MSVSEVQLVLNNSLPAPQLAGTSEANRRYRRSAQLRVKYRRTSSVICVPAVVKIYLREDGSASKMYERVYARVQFTCMSGRMHVCTLAQMPLSCVCSEV